MSMITRNDAEALIPVEVTEGIIQGVAKQSAAMQMFRRLPNMASGRTEMRVLDALPVTYWQTSDTATKKTTKAAWDKKFIYAEELAVIVPIAENTLDDADYDIWAEIQPRLIEAFGKAFDAAVFVGKDKPAKFRADLVTSIKNAGAMIDQDESETLYSAINRCMVKVEESGYNPSGLIGGVATKGKFRMMTDTTGQPITGTEIDSLPKAYVDSGAWNNDIAQFIIGDMTQAVYAMRKDITFKILEEAVIQDPTTGEILYNLAQQDMIALRAVMRIGWEIPNPINSLSPDESVRFPFSGLNPSTPSTTYNVTFTITDDASAAVANVKVTFGGQVKKTNASGVAVFKANANTSFLWSAKKGDIVRYGETAVATSAVAVDVEDFQ